MVWVVLKSLGSLQRENVAGTSEASVWKKKRKLSKSSVIQKKHRVHSGPFSSRPRVGPHLWTGRR